MKFNTTQTYGWWYAADPRFPQVVDTEMLEERIQAAFIRWMAVHYPTALVYHPQIRSKRGVVDLFIWYRGFAAHIELKKWHKYPTELQKEWLKHAFKAGCFTGWAMDKLTAIDLWLAIDSYITTEIPDREWLKQTHSILIPGIRGSKKHITGELLFNGSLIRSHRNYLIRDPGVADAG